MKNKGLIILVISLSILIPILFTITYTVPLAGIHELKINIPISGSMFDSRKFEVEVSEGSTYTVIFSKSTGSIVGQLSVYSGPFMVKGLVVESEVSTIEMLVFTAEKTDTYYIIAKAVKGFGFYSIIIEDGDLSSATPDDFINIGKLLGFLLPPILLSLLTTGIYFAAKKIHRPFSFRELNREVRKIQNQPYNYSNATTIPTMGLAVTYDKSPEEKMKDLSSIIKRYNSISLNELAQLLEFENTIALQEWLIDLPDSFEFKIDKGYVIIPEFLKTESKEAEAALKTITESLTGLKYYTCYYCGYPLEKESEFCKDCGKEIERCSVCKLPISFDDDVGKCSLCEYKAHLAHLQEWVKVNGACPHCLQEIPIESIVPVFKEAKK
ncbi:MAG: hypothetical protein FK734_17185 [Asgard group archaeon]|nr:hypothetical protein [Asgard group archaeon]